MAGVSVFDTLFSLLVKLSLLLSLFLFCYNYKSLVVIGHDSIMLFIMLM